MRRHLFPVLAVAAVVLMAPLTQAFAQAGGGGRGGDDDDKAAAAKRKKDSEWDDKQAPLPGLRNSGPCPFVKILYDAGRYMELKDNRAATSAVGYTGEIQGLSAGCRYKGAEPIHLEVEILFALGKGPQAQGSSKTYPYWIAVTDRNRAVLAKEYFSLPVKFAPGQDRVLATQRINSITIPRGGEGVNGNNFEVLVGFDVTPAMVDFNREGKRFRVNAGSAAAPPSPSAGSAPTQ
jgi:hypothetical protein